MVPVSGMLPVLLAGTYRHYVGRPPKFSLVEKKTTNHRYIGQDSATVGTPKHATLTTKRSYL